jgi:hypothetical protein
MGGADAPSRPRYLAPTGGSVVAPMSTDDEVIQFSAKPIATISSKAVIHERSGRFNETAFTGLFSAFEVHSFRRERFAAGAGNPYCK